MHPMLPEPFDTSELRFRKAFKEVISRPAFNMLREQDYEGSFCATRREPMWRFWVELKHRYSELLMR